MPPHFSLRARLLLLVLIAVIPALLLITYSGVEQRHRAANRARTEALLLTHHAAADQARWIAGTQQLLVGLAELPPVQTLDPAACNATLRRVHQQFAIYTVLGVADLNGMLVCSSLPMAAPIDLGDRSHLRRAIQTREFAVGDFVVGRPSGKASLNLGQPVFDADGEPRAVVMAALDLDWLIKVAAETHLPPDATLTVVDRDGTVLAHYPDPATWLGRSLAATPLFDLLEHHHEGTAELAVGDMPPALYAYTRLDPDRAGSPSIAIGIPTRILYAEADWLIQRNVAGLVAVTFLTLVVAWLGSSALVLKRLQAISRVAQRIERGDLSARSGLRHDDELGAMARAVDDMAAALQQRQIERERAERALGESEQRLSAIVNHAPVILFAVDRDGLFTLSVGKGLEQLGLRPGDVVGHSAFDLYEGTEVPDQLRRTLAGEAFTHTLDIGDQVFETHYQPLSGPDGRIDGVIGVATDVTARKQAEEALRRAHTELEQRVEERTRALEQANASLRAAQRQVVHAEKQRALGQMADGVAHDLNQSLALVAGYAELAQHALAAAPGHVERLQELLTIIAQAAHDGGDTVKRLLIFARGRTQGIAESSEPVHVAELLHDVARFTAPHWRDAAQAEGRPIHLTVESAEDPVIQGRPAALREVLINLILNAVDAMPNGGTLSLRAQVVNGQVVIHVTDSGVGIPPDVQDQIFEPFFTTKGDRGTGLGLAMVYGIVESHDGQIAVRSEAGQGTSFTLSFPAVAAPAYASQAVDQPRVAAEQVRILVVDDEPGITRMAALMLRQHGHQVTTAMSGEEALVHLEACPFDLVISDVTMGPGMNGWELTASVRQRWPEISVILATGWGATIDPAEARARGVSAVIAKPYRLADLAKLVAASCVRAAPSRRPETVNGRAS